jgi:hypothetical protein
MSDTTITEAERDTRTGRFLPGNSGFGGPPKGARSKFSEAFIQDLHAVWEEKGLQALEKCAREEPGVFIRVCASLMPKDVRLDVGVTVNPVDFVARFRSAQEMLGNEPPRRKLARRRVFPQRCCRHSALWQFSPPKSKSCCTKSTGTTRGKMDALAYSLPTS